MHPNILLNSDFMSGELIILANIAPYGRFFSSFCGATIVTCDQM